MKRSRYVAWTAVAALLLMMPGCAFASNIAAASTIPAGRLIVPNTKPVWATPAASIGSADVTQPVDTRVYLAGRDPAGVASYALAVSTPGSPVFRHYLSPAEFDRRYGPTPAQRDTVIRWASGAGLRVTDVTSHYVAVHGSLTATTNAFGTRLHNYRAPDGIRRAPDSDITIPAWVAPAVLTVTGLTADPVPQAHVTSAALTAPTRAGETCSRYYGEKLAATLPPAYGHPLPYTVCGYEPQQIRSAYGVEHSGLTGRGITVAVVVRGASPTITADTDTFFQRHGLPRFRPGQLTQSIPTDVNTCPAGRHWGEETLDIESVHTMAPDADIAYVAAGCATTASTEELDAETRIVDQHLASIVTDSWGSAGTEQETSPDTITAWERTLQQGAIEGIGFYFASGDDGDESTHNPNNQAAVEFPQSDPWVTAVGGTSLAVDEHGRYQWETGWGALTAPLSADGHSWTGLPGTFDAGAGGGTSTRFPQPLYQRGIVPDHLSHPNGSSAPMRVLPDIAADADGYTGMVVGMTSTVAPFEYHESPAGGTSMSSPLIAGIQADAEQAQHGLSIGFANPAIYARYHTAAFHDVTDEPLGPGIPVAAAQSVIIPDTATVRNRAIIFGHDTSLHAVPGYDDVTGVGTPTRAYLDSYRS